MQGPLLAPPLTPPPAGQVRIVHGGTSHALEHLHSFWAPPTEESPHIGTERGHDDDTKADTDTAAGADAGADADTDPDTDTDTDTGNCADAGACAGADTDAHTHAHTPETSSVGEKKKGR